MNAELELREPRFKGHFVTQDSHYAWYVVFLLTFAYTIAFIDRQVLNLLVDPIKQDLILSDVEISFLQGFAFMASYVICGPIFGRWADSGNRRNILIFGITMWSVFTVLCGMATNFWQLFATRAGVGAAEASLAPVAWSMIADYFSKRKLSRAMSIFLLGPSLGAGLALVAGGVVIAFAEELSQAVHAFEDMSQWQITFVMVGVPGLLLALLMLSVKEPVRTSFSDKKIDNQKFTVKEIFQYIWNDKAFFLKVFCGMGVLAIVIYGLPTWMPTYMIRHFEVEASVVGVQYGALVLAFGAAGIISGPSFGRFLERMGYGDSSIRSAVICSAFVLVGCSILPLADSYKATLAVSAFITFFYALPQAMVASALQLAAPNRLRGVISTLYLFMISVCGLGIAPSLIAFVTDHIVGGPKFVGVSLISVCIVSSVIATVLFYGAMKPYLKKLGDGDLSK